MAWQKPNPPLVWQAITSYLAIAYEGPSGPTGIPANTPSAVKSRLESLRLAPASVADFFASPVFERDSAANPTKFSLRLGNRHYPHMKLIVERSPDTRGHLFRADTHDAHCCPAPGSRDYFVFSQLMDKNREVAEQIESAWEQQNIPTFKAYLRDDLARRKSQQASG
jgi:hypothetical protein